MYRYIGRRLAAGIPTLIGITVITFLLLHATAGSWVPGLEVSPDIKPEDIARIRHSLGLDEPLAVQYWIWFSGLLHGDLGRSLVDGSAVSSRILVRLPNSLMLTATAAAVGILVAIPAGTIAAVRRGTRTDNALTFLSVIGVSVPAFWLGLLLIFTFAISFQRWGLPSLPTSGVIDPVRGGDLLDRAAHLLMPSVALAFVNLAVWSRFTRSSMLETLAQDYVRTARAKGLRSRRVLYVHAFRNAVLPLITLIGLEIPALVGGGAIIEIVFSWPGIGRLALESALARDYTTVLGLVTLTGFLVIIGNLLADILYAIADPRIRLR